MSTLPLVYESPRPRAVERCFSSLMRSRALVIIDHVGGVTILEGNDPVLQLLTGVVQADVKVLGVAGGNRVGRDVDGWLVVLEDCRRCTVNADVGEELAEVHAVLCSGEECSVLGLGSGACDGGLTLGGPGDGGAVPHEAEWWT